MSINRWINKNVVCVCVYKMEYSSAKKEIMSFPIAWMELVFIKLSEGIQKEKDKWHIISLIRRI